jgi:hypothetical protein
MNAACSFSLSFGGGVVRVATAELNATMLKNLGETSLGILAVLGIVETHARTLCGFFFTTVSALRPGFLEGFASDFFASI